MPRSPLSCLQQVRWWVGSECFYEEPLLLLHYMAVSESPTLVLVSISDQCTQQRLNIRSRQQDPSSLLKTIKNEQRVVSAYMDAQIDIPY